MDVSRFAALSVPKVISFFFFKHSFYYKTSYWVVSPFIHCVECTDQLVPDLSSYIKVRKILIVFLPFDFCILSKSLIKGIVYVL